MKGSNTTLMPIGEAIGCMEVLMNSHLLSFQVGSIDAVKRATTF